MKKTDFKPYSISDIDILIKEPWEVSDQPFRLHAAYALSSLFDTFFASDDEDEPVSPEDMWGKCVPKKLLDRLVEDIKADFNDAAQNYKPVKIWGRSYSIRKVNAYDHERLNLIFDFPLNGDEYTITKEGVLYLVHPMSEELKPYEVTREKAKANRTYLRQIIKLAEDDANNGWDKLTDMEVVVYCWAQFYNKHQYDNFIHFLKDWKDYIYVPESEIKKCFNEKASLGERPAGMYTFSFEKVQKWNEVNKQRSYASDIPPEEADDYWYDVALKSTFKPIDHK